MSERNRGRQGSYEDEHDAHEEAVFAEAVSRGIHPDAARVRLAERRHLRLVPTPENPSGFRFGKLLGLFRKGK